MDKDNITDIYTVARKLAGLFYMHHSLTYLDYDDFVQEAVLGCLEDRNMKHAMIDAFRKAAPLSRNQVGEMEIPIFTGPDELLSNDISTEKRVLLQQIWEQVEDIDPELLDILYRHFIIGETLTSIAESYGVTSNWLMTRKYKCLKLLRKRCRYDSRKYPWRHGSDSDSNRSD